MFYLFSDNIARYFFLLFKLWFWNNRINKYWLFYSSFLYSSHHLCIFSINILTTTFIIRHILKHEHLWLLYIIIGYRSYWKHPHLSIITIFARLYICVRLTHKLYPSTVDIFASIHNLKQMNINSIIIRFS